jgi:hypothetical protein
LSQEVDGSEPGGFEENQINHNGSACVEFNLLFTGNCRIRFPNIRHPVLPLTDFSGKL